MGVHQCPDIIEISALEDYRVRAKFADGKIITCDLLDLLNCGVFKKLRDKKFFSLVHADNGAAVWNEDIDLAPEYLYEHGEIIA